METQSEGGDDTSTTKQISPQKTSSSCSNSAKVEVVEMSEVFFRLSSKAIMNSPTLNLNYK